MRVDVEATALVHAAAACDRGAQTAAGVAASLRPHRGCDTGRADTRAAVAALLERFDAALVGLGATLEADAAALRASSRTYLRADGRIAQTGRR